MARVTSTCLLVLLVLTFASDSECRRTGSSSRRGSNRGNSNKYPNKEAPPPQTQSQQPVSQQQSPIVQSAQAPSLQSSNHPGGQGSNTPGQGLGFDNVNKPQQQSPIAQGAQQPIGWNVPNAQHGNVPNPGPNHFGQSGSHIPPQGHSPIVQSAQPAYPVQGGYGGAHQPPQYNPQYGVGGYGHNPAYMTHHGGYPGGGYGGGYGMGYGGGYGGQSHTGSNMLIGLVGGLLVWNLVSGHSSQHYTVHNYYNEGMKNETIKLEANAIINCPQNATLFCPPNTTSLCTSDSKILCVTIATIPCANDTTMVCVNSTIPPLPCINGSNPNGPCNETSIQQPTSVNIPCITNASILGDLKDANATVLNSALFQNSSTTQFCVTTIAIPQKPSLCNATVEGTANGTACNPTNVDNKAATPWPVAATAVIAENNTMIQLDDNLSTTTTGSTYKDK